MCHSKPSSWIVVALGALLISGLTSRRVSAEGRELSLSHPSHVLPGDTLSVVVEVDEIVGLSGFRFEMAFDESLLSIAPEDVGRGDDFPSGQNDLTIASFLADETLRTPGEIIVSGVNIDAVTQSGRGAILQLDFQVNSDAIGPDGADVSTLVDFQDARLNELELSICNPPVSGPDSSDSSCDGDDCEGSNVTITLPDIGVDPRALEFEHLLVGETAELDVAITNADNVDLSIFEIQPTAESSSEFAVISGGVSGGGDPLVLAPSDDAHLVTIRYTPTNEGADSGTLRILSDAFGDEEILVSFDGSAELPVAEIVVDVVEIDFGELNVGDPAAEATIRVTNAGNGTLEVDAATFRAGSSEEFAVSQGGEAFSIAPGAPAHEVTLTYTPVDGGEDTGGLVLTSNAGNEPTVTIELRGSAIAGTPFRRGDADGSGALALTDAIKLLGFLFQGQSAPTCMESADADDNGELQLTDAILVLGYLFLGRPPPPAPGPDDCGFILDGSSDLGCESYDTC